MREIIVELAEQYLEKGKKDNATAFITFLFDLRNDDPDAFEFFIQQIISIAKNWKGKRDPEGRPLLFDDFHFLSKIWEV